MKLKWTSALDFLPQQNEIIRGWKKHPKTGGNRDGTTIMVISYGIHIASLSGYSRHTFLNLLRPGPNLIVFTTDKVTKPPNHTIFTIVTVCVLLPIHNNL